MGHLTIQLRPWGVVLAAGILLASCSSAPLLAAPAAGKGHTVHVEVLAQAADGSPMGYLKAKDFVATAQGATLPLAVVRPVLSDKPPTGRTIPTRMLVVVTSPAGDSVQSFKELLSALVPVWQRGWKVAIAKSDDHVTDYALNAAQLQQMWAAPAKSDTSAKEAVGNLGDFMGRRIVMVLAGNQKASTPAPDWLRPLADKEKAQVFVVDGGQTVGVPEMLSGPLSGGYLPPVPAPPTCYGSRCRGIGRTSSPGSEVNVHRAVRDAIHLALGYYDIRVSYPSADPIPTDAMLSLQIKGPSAFQVTAQAYGKSGVPELQITRR